MSSRPKGIVKMDKNKKEIIVSIFINNLEIRYVFDKTHRQFYLKGVLYKNERVITWIDEKELNNEFNSKNAPDGEDRGGI